MAPAFLTVRSGQDVDRGAALVSTPGRSNGSSYTSPYLAFVPVETHSNVLVSPKANKGSGASYRVLRRLTPAEQAVFDKYDNEGSTPFIDFANRAAQTGSGILPNLVAGGT
jgi:hypothetical protein